MIKESERIITDKTEKIVTVESRRKMKKAAFMFVAPLLIAVLGLNACGWGGGTGARIMAIHSVDGENVSIIRDAQAATAAVAGSRLHAGYGVQTGADSFCFIRLDEASLVKMDLHSKITIEQETDSLLAIAVESGQILVDVQELEPGHELLTRVGNTAMAVRGTLFVASNDNVYEAVVIMLEGEADVGGVPLGAGYVIRVYDELVFEIEPIRLEDLDAFQQRAVADNWERLVASGIIPRYITIQGVSFSTWLTELDLTGRRLTSEDILPLRYMVNLTVLFLGHNEITDIQPLSGLTSLTHLQLQFNQIEDLSPLAGLRYLNILDLQLNRISDISPLAGLANLQFARLGSNYDITDWTPVAHVGTVYGSP